MDKYLPIGTIVFINNELIMRMIVGYFHEEDNSVKDYISIPFPYGFMKEEFVTYFDHKDIDEVLFVGYKNDNYEVLNKKLIQLSKEW